MVAPTRSASSWRRLPRRDPSTLGRLVRVVVELNVAPVPEDPSVGPPVDGVPRSGTGPDEPLSEGGVTPPMPPASDCWSLLRACDAVARVPATPSVKLAK